MKKLLFLSLILLIVSFLASCRKDEPVPPTIVNGQVLEQGSNKPLEGVKVVLMEGTYNGIGSGTYSFYPVDTFLTDKDGKYSYEHKIPFDKKAYELWYFKDKYFDINNVSENDRITRIEYNKTKVVTTTMFPFAWLSVRVINDKPFDASDRVEVAGDWQSGGGYLKFYGNKINTTFNKQVRGGKKSEIFWWVYKNNTANFNIDSLSVNPNDTSYYTIKY